MPTLTIKSDEPVVVVPLNEYEALLETIEILSDPTLKQDIEQARADFQEGRTISLDKLRAELDADLTLRTR